MSTENPNTPRERGPARARVCSSAIVRPDWLEVAAAYDEAAEHLELCASESRDAEEKAALKLVAGRIRAAGNRVRPNEGPKAPSARVPPQTSGAR
jgi:hypothetical protein